MAGNERFDFRSTTLYNNGPAGVSKLAILPALTKRWIMVVYQVKNRYKETFRGKFDGVSYEVPGNGSAHLPDFIATHIRNQSVIKDNPVTGEREFRLAIVELGDDDSPLLELPLEVMDRTDMELRKVKIVDLRSRPIPPARHATGIMTSKERGA